MMQNDQTPMKHCTNIFDLELPKLIENVEIVTTTKKRIKKKDSRPFAYNFIRVLIIIRQEMSIPE